MESDKYIVVRETDPTNSVVIVDLASPLKPLKRPITADSALMNPTSKIIALKAANPGGVAGDNLQIFNLDAKAKLKSVQFPEQIVFWKWITDTKLGLVTVTAVYHWSMNVSPVIPLHQPTRISPKEPHHDQKYISDTIVTNVHWTEGAPLQKGPQYMDVRECKQPPCMCL